MQFFLSGALNQDCESQADLCKGGDDCRKAALWLWSQLFWSQAWPLRRLGWGVGGTSFRLSPCNLGWLVPLLGHKIGLQTHITFFPVD